eukprot:1913667-Ditylum_brightwellii.AAC.1
MRKAALLLLATKLPDLVYENTGLWGKRLLDMLLLKLFVYKCNNYTRAGIGTVSALSNKCKLVGLVSRLLTGRLFVDYGEVMNGDPDEFQPQSF